MKNKAIIGVIVLLVVAGAIAASIFFGKQQSGRITLTIAYENSQLDATLLIAKEQKIFEKYLPDNVDTEWTMLDNGSDRRDALATERVSIATINNLRIITAIENNYPIKILANGMGQPLGLYSAIPDLAYPDGIVGKTIVYQGSYSTPLKSDLSKNFGISTNDYELLMVGGDQELLDMLVQGRVDAAVMNNEKAAKATALSSNIRELRDLTPEYNRLGLRNWFVGSSKFFEKYPELLSPIMLAYDEAMNVINNSPAEAAELISSLLEIDAEQIEKEFRALPPVIEVYGYDDIAQIIYEDGGLDKPAKPFNQLSNYESIPKK